LALVVNELVTNTIKHAARAGGMTHIAVEIALEQEADISVPTARLIFRDDGPGYPPQVLEEKYHSVGLELIPNIIRKNLHGTLAIYNDHGAVTVIRFPVDESTLIQIP